MLRDITAKGQVINLLMLERVEKDRHHNSTTLQQFRNSATAIFHWFD
jgi:hypothetical protein